MSYNSQTILSVFHYRMTFIGGSSDGEGRLTDFLGVFNGVGGVVDKLADAMVESVSFFDVRAQFIYPTRFRVKVVSPNSLTGNIAEPGLPQNVAAAITKRGDGAGRHQHGTLHVTGLPFTAALNGIVVAAHLGRLTALGQEVARQYLGLAYTPVIFNRANPVTSVRLTDTTPENTVRTMRRRTVGLGI